LWGENSAEPTFKYPYKPDGGRENLHAPDEVYRVLRGGAFWSVHQVVPCAYRGRRHARGFYDYAGFRVVMAGLP
jgi:formylglycine-generating enzyme required for sulfatase activity